MSSPFPAYSRLPEGWQQRLNQWLEQSTLAEDLIPFLASVVVGVITGLGAYLFIEMLDVIRDYVTGLRENEGILAGMGAIMLGGLLTGLIISQFASEAKGHGVPEVMEAVGLRRGRIRPRVAIAKIVASAITIGSGGSAGREGPIVQVGSTLGSTAGQWLKMPDEQIRVMVGSGAAAGIAATFNAPIAGSMFALEIILGRFSNRYLGMVVVSSVSANVVSRSLLGTAPAFKVPAYPLNSAWELPLYLILAILCALGAVAFIRLLYKAEDIFDNWNVALPVRTTVGMALTGMVALANPDVLGPGLEFIGESIAEDVEITIGVMMSLFFLKLLATIFTLGSGNSGGVFAPGLFMGAMLGGIVGHIGKTLFPGIVIDPGAFALVGMAAMFAGAARAPITAIIIVLEMSNDYRLIVPLMMCVVISTLLAEVIQRESIYTLKLALRGIHLERGEDVDLMQSVAVEEVMTVDYEEVPPSEKLIDLIIRFNRSHHHGFPIVNEVRKLLGIVTLMDVERAQNEGVSFDVPATEVGTLTRLITVYPDDPVYLALRRMKVYGVGRLPVVSRERSGTYMGIIRRSNILNAYELSIRRKSLEQSRQERLKLRTVEDNAFLEIEVVPDAPMVGKLVREFPFTGDCLLVSIRRGGRSLIAKGTTKIEVGDIVTAYAKEELHDVVRSLFASSTAGLETVPETESAVEEPI